LVHALQQVWVRLQLPMAATGDLWQNVNATGRGAVVDAVPK
jgi:hypothetical protein